MLVLTRHEGEKIVIRHGDAETVLTIVRSGRNRGNVKLAFEAPPDVRIARGELVGRFAESVPA